jgi:hypothetical protein
MDTIENAQKRAEYWKAESMAATKEIELLRAQMAELADAFTVIWVSDDRAAWDGKAVEHFDALLAKVGGSDTATPKTFDMRGDARLIARRPSRWMGWPAPCRQHRLLKGKP